MYRFYRKFFRVLFKKETIIFILVLFFVWGGTFLVLGRILDDTSSRDDYRFENSADYYRPLTSGQKTVEKKVISPPPSPSKSDLKSDCVTIFFSQAERKKNRDELFTFDEFTDFGRACLDSASNRYSRFCEGVSNMTKGIFKGPGLADNGRRQ